MLSKRKNIGLIIFQDITLLGSRKALFKIEGRELLGHVLDRTKRLDVSLK